MKEHTHFREDGTEYTHVHHNGDGAAEPHVHHHDHGGTGHVHRHVHSAEEKKKVMNRLSRAIGHLEAVKRMVERDEDCSEVLIQLAAVRSAINNTGKVIFWIIVLWKLLSRMIWRQSVLLTRQLISLLNKCKCG